METSIKPPQCNKESIIQKDAGKKIVLCFPRDVALSNSEVKEDSTARILSKENEMCQCKVITHI
eukprot:7707527-Ditylum_brightwellii.AAC.1